MNWSWFGLMKPMNWASKWGLLHNFLNFYLIHSGSFKPIAGSSIKPDVLAQGRLDLTSATAIDVWIEARIECTMVAGWLQ